MLKDKEAEKIRATEEWTSTELHFLFQQKNKTVSEYEKSKIGLAEAKNKIVKLEKSRPELRNLVLEYDENIKILKVSLGSIEKYINVYKEYNRLSIEKDAIIKADVPNITENINLKINISEFDYKEIIRRIGELKPILNDYGSIENMRTKVREQRNILDDKKTSLKQNISQVREVIKLIDFNKKGTLFSEVLTSGKPISESQETIILSLLNVNWGKPDEVKKGLKYTDTLDVLNEANIVKDKIYRGFWLKMGGIYEFFPFNNKQRLFGNPDNIKQAIKERKNELQSKIVELKRELAELEQFERGKTPNYEEINLPNNYKLDKRLYDFSRVNSFEETAAIIMNLDEKTIELDKQLNNLRKDMSKFREQIDIGIEIDDSKLHQIKKNTVSDIEKKEEQFHFCKNELTKIDTEVKNLLGEIIPLREDAVAEKEQKFNDAELNFMEKDIIFKKEFPNIKIKFNPSTNIDSKELKRLERIKKDCCQYYEVEYKSILGIFQETKNQSNIELNIEVNNNVFNFQLLEKTLLGKITHLDNIDDELEKANNARISMIDTIHETMLKIFKHTQTKYEEYKRIVRSLNAFFKDKKISHKYYLEIEFDPHPKFSIDWINQLNASTIYKKGELAFGNTVETVIEDFFRKITDYKSRINFSELLDPKTYFELKTKLRNEDGKEITGSTGQTYSAIVLLGIGRLSKVESNNRKGLRFVILEETANLDKTNFNTFPSIAKEFGYQIITMTPQPYGSDTTHGWYIHHLLPGSHDDDINYPVPCSYFKTNEDKEDLKLYLQSIEKT